MEKQAYPYAIAMWDFSWLERRWPGAGYENWDQVLDELLERGYDVVRIDAYPHLLAADPEKEWELLPCWNQQTWGSPALTKVVVRSNFIRFLTLCKERNLRVAISTWFREDRDNVRMNIKSANDIAGIWKSTLDIIQEAGLLDTIYFVDLCNEFPMDVWAPFLAPSLNLLEVKNIVPEATKWMKQSIEELKKSYPQISFCYSFSGELEKWEDQDVSFMDLFEPHIWMVQFSDFYQQIGYHFDFFETTSFENLVQKGESLYRSDPAHWKRCLSNGIELYANWSRKTDKPLVTTECWGIVDYKDWPLLNWDWVKEICEHGVREASATGRWAAIATSNFCGPQFVGMWRNIAWHREMTDLIHQGLYYTNE